MKFTKSQGLTTSEELLANLCEKSFLHLWTYPNLFFRPGRELADLIVVWGNEVIIFSDKSNAYPSGDDATLNWTRWYRRAIWESAEQIRKAEKWIKSFPDKVYLDSKASVPLPLKFGDPSLLSFHHVCVVTGASERCLEATGNPSLSIDLTIKGDEKPFCLGRLNGTQQVVHVLDEVCLKEVLGQLNTVKDFIDYLNAKSEVFQLRQLRYAANELDLLAYYLWHDRSFPTQETEYQIERDVWKLLNRNQQFINAQKANEVGVFWDGLIEYFTKLCVEETLESGNEYSTQEQEKFLRILASEPRFHRRILAGCVVERLHSVRDGEVSRIGTILPSHFSGVHYVFLIGKGAAAEDYAAYRDDRWRELQLRCWAAKAREPDAKYIVGIALDASRSGGSEEFLLLNVENWSAEELEQAEYIRTEMGYFATESVRETRIQVDEYPEI